MTSPVRALRTLWSSVKVQSCADGTLRIAPRWRKKFRDHGVLTRMHAALQLQDHLNGQIKKKR